MTNGENRNGDLLRSFFEDSPDRWTDPLLRVCRDAARAPQLPEQTLSPELRATLRRLGEQYSARPVEGASSAAGNTTSAVLLKVAAAALAAGALATAAFFFLTDSADRPPDNQREERRIEPSRTFGNERALREYYGSLQRVVLTDGRSFLGRVEKQVDGNVRVHTVHEVIEIHGSLIARIEPERPTSPEK